MPQLGPFLHKARARNAYFYWCPGCEHAHEYDCEPPRGWTFNGDIERPTFSPSMRVFLPAHNGEPEKTLCHHFVTNGQIIYLSDCDHKLATQQVPMVPVSEHADYGWGDS